MLQNIISVVKKLDYSQQAWNHLECMVKQYLELEISGEYAHVITGTYGIKEVLNQENEGWSYSTFW